MGAYKREYKLKGRTVWYYQLRYRKSKHAQAGFATEKEAKDAERKKIAELKSKRNRPVPRQMATFDQWLPRFIAFRHTMRKSPRTIENERRRGNFLKTTFGARLVRDITVADIQSYVASRLQEGMSHRTINLELTFLRSFFKHAIQHHVAENNPARDVPSLPLEEREEVWIPTEEEFLRFVEAAKQTPTAKYIVPWIWLRALTGCRPSESFFLEWSDIDLDGNRIWFRPKNGNPLKNRKKRYVPMHPHLKPILKEWRREWEGLHCEWLRRERIETARRERGVKPDHEWVFIHPHDHGMRTRGYHGSFYEARKAADLPRLNSYTLRHYFASMCIKAGIPLLTIARWMGHASIKMLETTYGHILPDDSAAYMDKLNIWGDGWAACHAFRHD